jgi:glucosyl-3-phosphoglycerate synthase
MCTTSSFLHTVIIPGKEVASTVTGVITKIVQPLIDAEVVSRLVVIDAASLGGTGKVATSHGTEVIQRKDIAPELGPSCGKGDALWRALLVTDGDIAAFLDGDTGDPDPAHLIGIIGPLLLHDNIQMVRASFDRPSKSASGDMMSHEGGRITEILARPLLDSYWPELAGFSQPLAGEFAARRSLLENLAFLVSYGIEIATLVDTYNLVGLGGMAQTDVGCRQNPHQPLRKLAVMAQEIMSTAMRRAGHATLSMKRMYLPWKDEFQDIESIERPPVAVYEGNSGVLRSNKSEEALRYPGPPFVNIEGVRMFRDIGGYQTSDGSSVRKGLMFRSGGPSSMTPDGLDSFQKLAIGKVFDLRSPIETTTFVHGHAKHADSGFASPDESDSDAVKSMLLSTVVEVIAAPVFPDEEWLPQRRYDRLKQYASAAQVRSSQSPPFSKHLSNTSTGLRRSLQTNPNPRHPRFPPNLPPSRLAQPLPNPLPLLSGQRPYGSR